MNPLQWQNAENPSPTPHNAFSVTTPWFAVAMGLTGLIVGYSVGASGGPSSAPAPSAAAQPVAVVPSAAPTPAPTPTPPPPSPSGGPVPPVDVKKDHIRGNPNATVAVIEYSDFQCPFCNKVHPTLKQVLTTYGDKVMWVYRHYPLGFHPNAEPAAMASECANEQNKFWEMTDALFEKQQLWSQAPDAAALFAQYATELGLNAGKFSDCFASGKYKQHIQEDMAGGSAAGVSGTPGNIVLNLKTKKTQEVSGAQPLQSFQAAIDAALQQ